MENKYVIERIREFNRFYTVLIGTLNSRYFGSDFSVTETRVLFEIVSHKKCKAMDMVEKLNIDKSYISRILASFEKKGLIQKEIYEEDNRVHLISLTEKGRAVISDLITKSNKQTRTLVAGLNEKECEEVCQAMDLITKYFTKKK